jgi:hypothetical protein
LALFWEGMKIGHYNGVRIKVITDNEVVKIGTFNSHVIENKCRVYFEITLMRNSPEGK